MMYGNTRDFVSFLALSIVISNRNVAAQEIYQNREKWLLSVRMFLASFCCYDYGANFSEAVENTATDQKDYHKSSFHKLKLKSWLLGHL